MNIHEDFKEQDSSNKKGIFIRNATNVIRDFTSTGGYYKVEREGPIEWIPYEKKECYPTGLKGCSCPAGEPGPEGPKGEGPTGPDGHITTGNIILPDEPQRTNGTDKFEYSGMNPDESPFINTFSGYMLKNNAIAKNPETFGLNCSDKPDEPQKDSGLDPEDFGTDTTSYLNKTNNVFPIDKLVNAAGDLMEKESKAKKFDKPDSLPTIDLNWHETTTNNYPKTDVDTLPHKKGKVYPKKGILDSIKEEKDFNHLLDAIYPPSKKGVKHSSNKLRYELDWEFVEALAKRMQKNKGKYEPYNWKKEIELEELFQPLTRHYIEIAKGNFEDNGSEFGHLEALSLNAMMLRYQLKLRKEKDEE